MQQRLNFKTRCFLLVPIAVVAFAMAISSHAQTYTTLASFNVSNGDEPYYGPLVQGRDGNLYGTAYGVGLTRTPVRFLKSQRAAL